MRIQEDDPYVNPEGDPHDKTGRSEIHWGHVAIGVVSVGGCTYLGNHAHEVYGFIGETIGTIAGSVLGVLLTRQIIKAESKQEE